MIREATIEENDQFLEVEYYFLDGSGSPLRVRARLSWPEETEDGGFASKYAWKFEDSSGWESRKWVDTNAWMALVLALNELYIKCEDKLMVEGVEPGSEECFLSPPDETDEEGRRLEYLFGGALNPVAR